MAWWQMILVLLLGVLPCALVAFALVVSVYEAKTVIRNDGEILARLKGLHSIIARLEKQVAANDVEKK